MYWKWDLTLEWSPNQTSLLFFDYIRNATRWLGTSLFMHWYSWSNIGNIVGTSTSASRDRAFYSPPRPQMDYDEHVEACGELLPRFDRMLNKICGFHCWVQWGQGERLFCEHNRACCLSCGLTCIWFDAPEGHSACRTFSAWEELTRVQLEQSLNTVGLYYTASHSSSQLQKLNTVITMPLSTTAHRS